MHEAERGRGFQGLGEKFKLDEKKEFDERVVRAEKHREKSSYRLRNVDYEGPYGK
jgi:hypothetical protein